MATSHDIHQHLTELAEGVLFPSETDAPITAFVCPANSVEPTTVEAFLESQGLPTDTRVEDIPFESFLVHHVQEREGQGDAQHQTIHRIRALLDEMEANLTELRVYKIGEINFGIYVLGKASDSVWVGIHTQTVEA